MARFCFSLLFVSLLPQLTTPSGSTSSRCLGWPPCCPVRTYCPGVVPDSRTRKSPSCVSSLSASLRLKLPWNQASHCNCCTRGGAVVTELWPPCPETPRASSNGSWEINTHIVLLYFSAEDLKSMSSQEKKHLSYNFCVKQRWLSKWTTWFLTVVCHTLIVDCVKSFTQSTSHVT